MGYSTNFSGRFVLDKPMEQRHVKYLNAFSDTRRVRRDPVVTAGFVDPLRGDVGLPVGEEGGYYVGDDNRGILNGHRPPVGQPGLWCQWVPSSDGLGVQWDGGAKFYCYVGWLEYLVTHFLKPWGYVLSGRVEWDGEGSDDRGVIHVRGNVVKAVKSRLVADEPDFGDELPSGDPDPCPNPVDTILDLIDPEE